MLPLPIIVALVVGLAIVALLYFGARSLGSQTIGRVVLLVGVVALPMLLSAGNISYGFHQSSTTAFCLSCHEMRRVREEPVRRQPAGAGGGPLSEPPRRPRDRLLLVPQGLRDVRRRHGEAERTAARLGPLHRGRPRSRALQAVPELELPPLSRRHAALRRSAGAQARAERALRRERPLASRATASRTTWPRSTPGTSGRRNDDRERSTSPGRFVAPRSSAGSAWRCNWRPRSTGRRRPSSCRPPSACRWCSLGGVLFLAAVWRNMRDKGAL